MTLKLLAGKNFFFLCHHKTAQLTQVCCGNSGSEDRGEMRASDLELRQKRRLGMPSLSQPESNWPFCCARVSTKRHMGVREEKQRSNGGSWPALAPSRGMKPVQASHRQVLPLGREVWVARGTCLRAAALNPLLPWTNVPWLLSYSSVKPVQVCRAASTDHSLKPEAGRPLAKCCFVISESSWMTAHLWAFVPSPESWGK